VLSGCGVLWHEYEQIMHPFFHPLIAAPSLPPCSARCPSCHSNTPAHPEYPSGHQVSVGAILEVILRTLGGKDDVAFTISSEGTPWLTRSYKSLTAAANEVGGAFR
jgi:hypothetical protein